jgi:hypothetical protein
MVVMLESPGLGRLRVMPTVVDLSDRYLLKGPQLLNWLFVSYVIMGYLKC